MARAQHLSPRKIRNARFDGDFVLGAISSDIRAKRQDVIRYETRAADTFQLKQALHASLLQQSERLANMIDEAAQVPETLNFARCALASEITDTSRDVEGAFNSAVRYARQFDEHIIGLHATQYKLAALERKLVRTSADQLANVVRNHPMVNSKAQVVFSTLNGRTQVTFTTKPMILRPNRNPYKWIDNGEIPYVQLGAMQICADLSTAEVRIFPSSRNAISRHAYAGHRTAHPHILDRQSPCLGDFTSPLLSAADAGDISFFLDTLYVFLTTAADEDAAGRNWVRWLYADAYPGRTDAPCDGQGKQLSIMTKPDGTATLQWKRPMLEPKPLQGLVPAVMDYDFWDGKSIPKTGQIAYIDTTPAWLAWADDVLMHSTRAHPACSIDGLNTLISGRDALSPVLPEDQYRVAQRMHLHTPPKQEYWQLYQHDGYEPVVSPALFIFPHSNSDDIYPASFTGVCRPNGPMSRPVPVSEINFTNAPNVVDVQFTPTPSVPVSMPYCVLESFSTLDTDLRIGALTTRGFIISPPHVNDEGGVTYKVSREPFRPGSSAFAAINIVHIGARKKAEELGALYAKPLGEFPLPTRVAIAQDAIRTSPPAPIARVQQRAREWHAAGYTEEHFIPALWKQIAPFMEAAAVEPAPRSDVACVVLRDGQFVICA